MNTNNCYEAPWDKLLRVISVLLTTLCCVIALFVINHGGVGLWIGIGLLSLVLGCALFIVRGYTVTADSILVHRLFWSTRLPLNNLAFATFQPDVMRWSIRVLGNGGFFSFTGLYRNRLLGRYRAFVTDRQRTVVLRYPRRTVVISPDPPEEFVHELKDKRMD
jgi:hypothetical protein